MNVVQVRKRVPLKKKLIRITAIVLAAAILVAAGIFVILKNSRAKASYTLTPYTVQKGDISAVITGSGTVQPIEQYDVVSMVQGDILEDHVNVGDTVGAGDLLYRIDTTEAENNIRKSEISLEKQKLSYEETLESARDTTVTSPASGVIQKLYVKDGDNVNANSTVADIVSSDTLKLKIPFNAGDAQKITKGSAAQVYLETTGEEFGGTVTAVSSGTYATSSGAVVTDVEITFANPGALSEGQSATAVVGDYACNEPGTLSYAVSQSITAKGSGEVTGLSYEEGDRIAKGATLLVLSNTSSNASAKSSELSIQEAELDLEDMKNTLDNYNITSPISGTVISKSKKAGDTLDSSKTTLAVVADMSKLIFTMNVDELDIKSISVGQTVEITADALPDDTFTGTVTTIGIIGTSSSGVTTYPVEVEINDYEGLLPGMNVTANIVSEEVSDVLKVPVSAVSRGNVVLVTKEYAESIGAETVQSEKMGSGFGAQTESSAAGSSGASGDGQRWNRNGGSAPSGDSSGGSAAVGFPARDGSAAEGSSAAEGFPARDSSAVEGSSAATDGSVASGADGKSWVSGGASSAGKIIEMPNTPDGYVWLTVETGLSDDDFIEIKAGLSEGADVYIMTTVSDSTDTSSASSATGFGMMGGGMDGGNMPTETYRSFRSETGAGGPQ